MIVLPDLESDTLIVTIHSCGHPVMVRGKYRCSGCGHRLTVNGVAPRSTRTMPPWTWHRELRDRRQAKQVNVFEIGVARPVRSR